MKNNRVHDITELRLKLHSYTDYSPACTLNGMAVMHSKPRSLCERTCLLIFCMQLCPVGMWHLIITTHPTYSAGNRHRTTLHNAYDMADGVHVLYTICAMVPQINHQLNQREHTLTYSL